MVKIAIMISFLFVSSHGNVYEKNCLACHKNLPVSIDKYFYRYLLKYSSQRSVKKAMMDYMIQPSKEKTIMPEAFISRFGIKKQSNLSKQELEKAINTYWNEYKVFGQLK